MKTFTCVQGRRAWALPFQSQESRKSNCGPGRQQIICGSHWRKCALPCRLCLPPAQIQPDPWPKSRRASQSRGSFSDSFCSTCLCYPLPETWSWTMITNFPSLNSSIGATSSFNYTAVIFFLIPPCLIEAWIILAMISCLPCPLCSLAFPWECNPNLQNAKGLLLIIIGDEILRSSGWL